MIVSFALTLLSRDNSSWPSVDSMSPMLSATGVSLGLKIKIRQIPTSNSLKNSKLGEQL